MPTPEIDFQMNFEQAQQDEADKKLIVIFFKGTEKNEVKSAEAGRPIFDEFDYVKILSPGDKDGFCGDASQGYQQRFPTQWARYKAGQEQNASGTPLNMLSWLSMGQIAEFNAVHVHTVEQLVNMPDALSQKFMGHYGIKQKAQQYLDIAAGNAPAVKMQHELTKRDEQIEELQRVVKAMQDKLAEADKKG
jgi:hypothetical protein